MTDFIEAMQEVNTEEATIDAVAAVGAALGQAAAIQQAIEQRPSGDFGPPAAAQFFSVGQLCATFQLAPADVRSLMHSAGQRAALALNDVDYWSGVSVLAAHHKLQEASNNEE